ncbi:MAG TPA: DUF4142 domain-containing protein [Ramlibacter sp.]|nr:DUF4142 domain-containing protein [Ramlibacter sp.]
MNRWSVGLIGSVVAAACCAAIESEPVAALKPLVPGPAASQPLARPGMFAAGSAPFVKRLTLEQREEWRFLKEAAAAARFEHDSARLALAKSGDPQVRSLAAMLLNHHAGARAALEQMLHARNMAPPMLSDPQRKALTRLARLQGVKFDREWMEFVALRSQQESLAVFERGSFTARDPQLRAWIERTTPTVRYQLAAAERAAGGAVKFGPAAPELATRTMGASPAAPAAPNASDLGEGNMLLVTTKTGAGASTAR